MFSFFRQKSLAELIARGRLGAVRKQVNADNCNDADEQGHTPMCYARQHQQAGIIDYLLTIGAQPGAEKSLLIEEALATLSLPLLKVFLKHGCSLPATRNGLPLLHDLILNKRCKAAHVAFLQEHGCDINFIDSKITGLTLLAWYLQQRDFPVDTLCVEWLIKLGANVNLAQDASKTPVYIALTNPELRDTQETMSVTRFGSVLNKLVKGGVALDLEFDYRGKASCLALLALEQERVYGFIDLLKAGMPIPERYRDEIGSFLERGTFGVMLSRRLAKLNRERQLNLPASILLYGVGEQKRMLETLQQGDAELGRAFADLAIATVYRYKEKTAMLDALLSKGADINTPQRVQQYQFSPLQAVICYYRNIEDAEQLVQWLLDRGAAIECHGYSALHLALWVQNIALVRLLVKGGARLNWQDDNKGTLLSYLVTINPWGERPDGTQTGILLRQLDEIWRSKGQQLPLATPVWYNNTSRSGELWREEPLPAIAARSAIKELIPFVRAILDIGWPLNAVLEIPPFSGNLIALVIRRMDYGTDISPLLDSLPEKLDVNSEQCGDPLREAIDSRAPLPTLQRLVALVDDINRLARYKINQADRWQYRDQSYLLLVIEARWDNVAEEEILPWRHSAAELLLQHGADPNTVAQQGPARPDDNGFIRRDLTALEWTLFRENFSLFTLLLDQGADPSCRTCIRNAQFIHFACGFSPAEEEVIIPYLDELERRGLLDINAVDNLMTTPLLGAVSKCRSKLVSYLLAHGAEVNFIGGFDNTGPLQRAVSNWCWVDKQSRRETVELLLAAGADASLRDPAGDTPLATAAGYGCLTALEALLEAGADPRLPGAQGKTAIHEAVLLDYGYDSYPDDRDSDQPQAMDVALKTAIIDALLHYGAEIDAVDDEGYSALFAAIWRHHHGLVEALVERGADINKTDQHGRTPLMMAAEQGTTESYLWLLEQSKVVQQIHHVAHNGNNLLHALSLRHNTLEAEAWFRQALAQYSAAFRANKSGITPLHYAAWQGNTGIVTCCCEYNLGINATDQNGNTPLHTALFSDPDETEPAQLLQIVTSLITAGADPALINGEGVSPLALAQKRQLDDIAVLMSRMSPGVLPAVSSVLS